MSFCVLAALAVVFSCSVCAADEIVFKNKDAKQIGTVVGQDEQGVTIFFPKESIKSISRDSQESVKPSPSGVILEENGAYITVKIPRQRLQAVAPGAPPLAPEIESASTPVPERPSLADSQLREKIDRLEKKVESLEKAGQSAAGSNYEALLLEEMGGVEGVISWNGKPLPNARVRIVMDHYTGFSLGALKKMFGKEEDKQTSGPVAVALDTQTDSEGCYSVSNVPPGFYTLYWEPDSKTGWVRRLRENPDFEVLPGKVSVLNIPEKKEGN